jgi:hypothetical protein
VDILDFILSNWWLLIPIIWLFSGAFGKKAKEQQERNHNPRPVEQTLDADESRDDSASMGFPWERVEEEPRRPSPQNRAQRRDIESYASNATDTMKEIGLARSEEMGGYGDRMRAQSPSSDITGQDLTSRRVSSLNEGYSKEVKNRVDFKRIDTTSVVQGMVWSQVFGKPRSKEPHRTSMYTRFGRRT